MELTTIGKRTWTRAICAAAFIGALLGGLAPPARASDIDIFGGATGTALPNILIILDNTSSNDASYTSTCPFTGPPANLPNATLLDMVYCSLYGAIDAIKSSPQLIGKLNIAVMVGGSGSNKGGQLFLPASSPYNPILMDAAGIQTFENAIIAGIPKTTNTGVMDGDMVEAWAWFTGNTSPRSGVSYSSHIGTLSCQKSFIIIIGATTKQGRPCPGAGAGCWAPSDLTAASWTAAEKVPIPTNSVGPYTFYDSSSGVDEWARFFYQTNFNSNPNDPQNIVTYTITAGSDPFNINPSSPAYSSPHVPDYVQELHSAANQGGGKTFAGIDYNAIKNDLLEIFNEVAAVNSVFASPSLPTSSLSQGSFANQIYIGMFRPDQSDNPRWVGNMKQYQFGVSGTASNPKLFLADSTGAAALSSATGFLSPGAISFWTSKDVTKLPDNISATGGFWVNNQQGQGQGFDSPDGEIVEKGGVSQQIRLANLQDNYSANPSTPRNVYTCVNSSGNCASTNALSSFPFATTNTGLTQASFGITGPTSSVSSISRTGNVVTMVLTAAPTPALTNGQSVTVSGAANVELNGTFTITLVNSTTFTYPITVSPPTPSTGTYTASVPSSPVSLTSLTRTGATTAQFTVAAGNANVFVNGQKVTILGATQTEYNGSVTLTQVNSTTYTYPIVPGPTTPTAGGTAKAGASTVTFTTAQISAAAPGASSPFPMTVTISQGSNLPAAFSAGATVTISSVVPGGYNGTFTIASVPTKKSFTYNLNSSPSSPATGTISADPSISVAIAAGGLTHTTSCTGASPSASVTVTATTATTNPFTVGQVVNINGTPGPRESAYVGSFTVISPVTSTSFTLSPMLTVSPPCSPSASGASVSTGAATIDLTSFINWVRGDDDVGDELSPDPGTITVRGSVHGDVLHSSPAVVNYTSGGTTNVVVFYGSNDGMFRAINGNQSGAIGSFAPGQEMWSFVAPEFFTELPRLYQNSPQVQLATTPSGLTPTPKPKDYYFDGPTGVYQNSDQSKTYIFLSARRGGRFIYALDVTSATSPKFLWKIANTNAGTTGNGGTGLPELGYTWSTPKAAFVRGYSNPVIIMGGGYDPAEDSEPPGTDTMGRGIFILDATNGNVVWSATFGSGGATGTCTGTCTLADMTYAIPADVTLLNRDFDSNGYIDRIYAADVGGNIWRVDLEPAGYGAPGASAGAGNMIGPSTWQITKFASLGGSGTTKRKFLYPPDVGITNSTFDMVLAGTGDREHPLFGNSTQAYGIVNRFYGLKDMNTGASVPSGWSVSGSTPGMNAPIVDSTSSTADNAVTGLTTVTASSTYSPGTSNNGFYFTFPNAGEKAVNAPTSIGGITFIGTSTPPTSSSNVCNNLGTARGYQINYLTGAGAGTPTVFTTGGLPPSPIAGLVYVTVDGVSRPVPFVLGGGANPADAGGGGGGGPDDTSSLGGHAVTVIQPARTRVYWYIDKHDN